MNLRGLSLGLACAMTGTAFFMIGSAFGQGPDELVPANASPELKDVTKRFSEISKIYRKSGEENGIRGYLMDLAKKKRPKNRGGRRRQSHRERPGDGGSRRF